MKQKKTSASRADAADNWAVIQQALAEARFSSALWNRIVRYALVFFLFLIIFIVPAGWVPGSGPLRQQVGVSEQQAQSASIGRLVWTWVSGGRGVFALRREEEMSPLVDETPVVPENATAQIPVLFHKSKASVKAGDIRGVYPRQTEPSQPDLDRALRRAFKVRVDSSDTLLKDSAAAKELKEIFDMSTQAGETEDLMEKRRTAQGAYMGAQIAQE